MDTRSAFMYVCCAGMKREDTTSFSSGLSTSQENSDITWSRRASRYLSQFRWYYSPSPATAASSSSSSSASLDEAWAHFEHVTLPRRYKNKVLRVPRGYGWEDSHLYPLGTPFEEMLTHFGGVSVGMFLSTLFVLAGILGVGGLLNIPLMIYFWGYSGNKESVGYNGIPTMIRASALCDATKWVECENCADHSDMPSYRFDYGLVKKNVCDFENFSMSGYASWAASVIMLILTVWVFYVQQRRAEVVLDEQIQTASDYSIKISNPPTDARDPEEWRSFFNQFIDTNESIHQQVEARHDGTVVVEDHHGGGVVLVTIAIDNANLLKALVKRRETLKKISHLLPKGTNLKDHAAVEELLADSIRKVSYRQKVFNSICRMMGHERDASFLWSSIRSLEFEIRSIASQPFEAKAVFVTFDSERSQRNALHALSTGKLNIWRNELDIYRLKLLHGGRLRIRESHRNASIWDLKEEPLQEKTIQLATSFGSTMSCSRVLLFRGERVLRVKEAVEPSDVRWVDLQSSSRQRFELHIASALGMLIFIALSGFVIYRLARNFPSQYAAMFITFTNSFVPVVCTFITDVESHPTEHGKQISLYIKMTLFRWYNSAVALSVTSTFVETISVDADFSRQSLIYQVYPVILAELFCNPLLEVMDMTENFRKHILAPRGRDQEEMNSCFTGGTFWLAERYTNINRVVFVALYYSSILPEALLLGAMALVAQYFAAKFSLLRLSGETPDVGFHLSRLGRNYFVPIILVAHFVMSAYRWSGYPYDNICEENESYTYCNQNLYGMRKFPLPRFQPNDSEWMTESQKFLTSLYGWTSLLVMMILSFTIFGKAIIPYVQSLYKSTYEPDGKDQGVLFTKVCHHEEVQGYIPQIKVAGFAFPLLACDISGIHEELIGWKDHAAGYKPHSLLDDVETITGHKHPDTFSVVRQWDPDSP